MMKDYDEYLKKKLAKIKKDGIMIRSFDRKREISFSECGQKNRLC